MLLYTNIYKKFETFMYNYLTKYFFNLLILKYYLAYMLNDKIVNNAIFAIFCSKPKNK